MTPSVEPEGRRGERREERGGGKGLWRGGGEDNEER
jgi:hypothetical protein